ncbi:Exportin-5 like protein [Argiope bruennichi]|uniref:Exportin-5 like protein n=1 Tax=Argiope bruennichi TaxID=94029 RepID=A0A8T0FFM1_ARGBR|nr:Exportin-5 like protein [Argiope bruennichi]
MESEIKKVSEDIVNAVNLIMNPTTPEINRRKAHEDAQTELVLLIFSRLTDDIVKFQNIPEKRRREMYMILSNYVHDLFNFFHDTLTEKVQKYIAKGKPSDRNMLLFFFEETDLFKAVINLDIYCQDHYLFFKEFLQCLLALTSNLCATTCGYPSKSDCLACKFSLSEFDSDDEFEIEFSIMYPPSCWDAIVSYMDASYGVLMKNIEIPEVKPEWDYLCNRVQTLLQSGQSTSRFEKCALLESLMILRGIESPGSFMSLIGMDKPHDASIDSGPMNINASDMAHKGNFIHPLSDSFGCTFYRNPAAPYILLIIDKIIHIISLHILGCSVENLGIDFYTIPELPTLLKEKILHKIEYMPPLKLRNLIHILLLYLNSKIKSTFCEF